MKAHEGLLKRLLKALVDEWGYDAVARAVADAALTGHPLAEHPCGPDRRTGKRRARPSATEQIERASIQGEQKEALMQLAVRYENEQFLPRIADVREFLIMMGERPVSLKDRAEAFRVLLRSLTQLPTERLQQLARSALHSGPSQLGPLSDAIAGTGEMLRRRRESETD